MAFGMKNQLLCRASFAILVSEEALSLTSRALDKHKADLENTNQFGRFREEVDEDLKTRIEYASKAFNDRVQARFDDLVATNWFADLPEYKKLQQFLDAIAAYDPSRAVPQLFEKTDRWLSTINDLLIALRHYVRGRIVWASQANIPYVGLIPFFSFSSRQFANLNTILGMRQLDMTSNKHWTGTDVQSSTNRIMAWARSSTPTVNWTTRSV